MDQRAETGAGRVRRLLTRALLVVGGTVAGTAAVWTLSAASAAADTTGLDPVAAVAEHVVPAQGTPQDQQHPLDGLLPAEVAPVVAPVAQVVENLDTALRSERAKTVVKPLEHVADGFRDTVGTVAERFQPPVQLPVTTSRGALVVSGGGKHAVHETPAPGATPVIDRSAPADAPATTSARTTFAGLVEKWTQDPVAQRGALPAGPRSTLPGDPSPLPFAPFAPVTAPVHCACGNDGSGSAGGQNAASSAAFVNAYDSAVARALAPVTERISVTPGKQPGATPD